MASGNCAVARKPCISEMSTFPASRNIVRPVRRSLMRLFEVQFSFGEQGETTMAEYHGTNQANSPPNMTLFKPQMISLATLYIPWKDVNKQ